MRIWQPVLLLAISECLCAQSTGVRVIPPREPRYREGAPIVIHVGQRNSSDVPARLSQFGFIDVIAARSSDFAEALKLGKSAERALTDEIGVIAWSKTEALTITEAVRWFTGESGALPRNVRNLAIIIWAPESNTHAVDQYQALQSSGVRWIRLNPSAQYVAEVSGRNAAILTDNPPNARFDNRSMRAILAPAPANGGPSDALGIAAAALELADRTHRGDW